MLGCFYFAKVIFVMMSPADQVQTCYYKPTYLTLVTAVTFALSVILVIYFSEIEALLS
jgi:formate/nitrite transporter FocA (FNT family)